MREEIAQVAGWLRLFVEPGQVTELRAIDVLQGRFANTVAGFFDHEHLEDMAREALKLTDDAVGVYFIPNPVHPDMLARACNKVKQAKKDEQVADKNIVRRKWLLIDADPNRLEGISSTDSEKAMAWEVIQKARDYLHATCITHSVLSDSGNGYHLLCRVDLPAADGDMTRSIINDVANKFETEHVKIDRKVFNAARIVKLYGTQSRKGDHVPERPHRLSKVIEERKDV